jgi:dipeptidyl-peptidase-4
MIASPFRVARRASTAGRLASVAVVSLWFSPPPVMAGAADGFDSLPGAERYRLVQSRLRQIGRGGTVGAVRFDEESARVFFKQGDTWMAVPWDGGEIVEVEEADVPEAAPREDRRGGRRAARGRQATREISPDGRLVAVHREHNVLITQADGSNEQAVTTDGTPEIRYGRASWVYGEELDQDTAMWWSPDSKYLACAPS